MLHDTLQTTPDASCADAGESVLVSRDVFERMQAELQFEKTRDEALNFEIAQSACSIADCGDGRLLAAKSRRHARSIAVIRYQAKSNDRSP